jgi:hypothetical protein
MKERNLPDRMESPEHHPSKEIPPVAQWYCRVRSAISTAVPFLISTQATNLALLVSAILK